MARRDAAAGALRFISKLERGNDCVEPSADERGCRAEAPRDDGDGAPINKTTDGAKEDVHLILHTSLVWERFYPGLKVHED